MIEKALHLLINHSDLSSDVTTSVARQIMQGKATETEIAAFLTALQMKGVTPDEIASFAKIMREFCHQISPKVQGTIIDTCGTGGDALKTFNISTIAAFIAAGAGIPVAKHGNRSITSKCGSADILEALGVNMNVTPTQVNSIIENVGIGFMFAPLFHPSMKYVQPVRRQLKIRTIFNILGPLTNPANAQGQVIGVYDDTLMEKMAYALNTIGLKHVLVVNGCGMDEISTIHKTKVFEVVDGMVNSFSIDPKNFVNKKPILSDIQANDLSTSVKLFLDILNGKNGPPFDIVMLNAAAAMIVGGKADNFQDGFELSKEIVKSGKAFEIFQRFKEESNRYEA